ncbi:MAG: transcriptional regulator [Pseudomonadota bacterium]
MEAPCREVSTVAATERLHLLSAGTLRWRRVQRSIFPDAVFRESCWDIMLMCFTSDLEQGSLCVKQIRSELDESNTSLLRRIQELEDAGMVQRQRDDVDGRRTIVRLTNDGKAAMARFFTMISDESAR